MFKFHFTETSVALERRKRKTLEMYKREQHLCFIELLATASHALIFFYKKYIVVINHIPNNHKHYNHVIVIKKDFLTIIISQKSLTKPNDKSRKNSAVILYDLDHTRRQCSFVSPSRQCKCNACSVSISLLIFSISAQKINKMCSIIDDYKGFKYIVYYNFNM